MKGRLSISIVFLVSAITVSMAPSTAEAAWWTPFVGWFTPLPPIVDTTTSTTTEMINSLQARISELEAQLTATQADAEATHAKVSAIVQATLAAAPAVAPAAAPVAAKTTSASDIAATVNPYLASINTSIGTFGGALIDSEGDALVDARAVIVRNGSGIASGTVDQVTVQFSSGAKKSAQVRGFDEGRGIAMVRIGSGAPSGHATVTAVSGLSLESPAYIFSAPNQKGIAAKVSGKGISTIEARADEKPATDGATLFDSKGNLIGIASGSTCRVVEDDQKCLSYSIAANAANDGSGLITKLTAGMMLYKDRQGKTDTEKLVRAALEGVYKNTEEGALILFAIDNTSGSNSFDNFNARLANDQDGKVTKLYLAKLKIAAQNIYKAEEYLYNQAHDFDIFLVDNSADISTLGDYQRQTLARIQADNAANIKEYDAKMKLWSAKRNEYDGKISSPSSASQDYLMGEGLFVEEEIGYLQKERQAIIKAFSGETLGIF